MMQWLWPFAILRKTMELPIKFKTPKKRKYLFQSVLVILFLLLFSSGRIKVEPGYIAVIVLSLAMFGTLLVHYPNINLKNAFYVLLMPLSLLTGAILFLNYFPNLGNIFKLVAIISFGLFYYLVSLVDNVFLVVEDREEIIPLYSVATAWSQVIQVIVAIPLFSGIFKLDTTGLVQSALVGAITFLFVVYQIWSSRYDKDAKNAGVGETVLLSALGLFMTFSFSAAVSFLPSEAFLRALLISAVLMFVLNYVASYLRNDINKKMIVEFILIFSVFLGVILFFTP
jgi:hypothetical protein